jgi:hypothetical protein
MGKAPAPEGVFEIDQFFAELVEFGLVLAILIHVPPGIEDRQLLAIRLRVARGESFSDAEHRQVLRDVIYHRIVMLDGSARSASGDPRRYALRNTSNSSLIATPASFSKDDGATFES